MKNHKIYYHTSWSCWDKSFHPKTKKLNQDVFDDWKYLLETLAIEIYTVTKVSKESLLQNYDLNKNKVHIVNHSVDHEFRPTIDIKKINKSFIYVGRLLEEKGIYELLKVFSENEKFKLSIVGKGKLKNLVEKFADSCPNITYHNYISKRNDLSNLLSSHEFIILNSKRNNKWEELFGMSLIEGMAHGLIPVAPMHPGPKEIIDTKTGYLFKEGNLENCLHKIDLEYPECKVKSKFSRLKVNSYKPEIIASLWEPILK
ncbi:MAG: glycosyltransferase family 4 protein [Psychroflexus sp.]